MLERNEIKKAFIRYEGICVQEIAPSASPPQGNVIGRPITCLMLCNAINRVDTGREIISDNPDNSDLASTLWPIDNRFDKLR